MSVEKTTIVIGVVGRFPNTQVRRLLGNLEAVGYSICPTHEHPITRNETYDWGTLEWLDPPKLKLNKWCCKITLTEEALRRLKGLEDVYDKVRRQREAQGGDSSGGPTQRAEDTGRACQLRLPL